MRIALIGQAAFGKAVLEALIKDGKDQVVGVFCPPAKPGEAADPVADVAASHGVPCHQYKRMRSPDAIAQFKALNADLAVMAFVTDIVPVDILAAPRLGTVQYHPSLLPRHRGPSSVNWPIILGEKETGLTVFWPDAGLDTGPILLQKKVEIGPDDTLGTLYFNKLFPLGVEAMLEAVTLVREGRAPKIPQDESRATYESWCTDEHAAIDWSRPAQVVYNLIRGCNPRPGAHTTYKGAQLRIFDSELQPQTHATERSSAAEPPGTVVDISENGITVAAPGGRVFVKRMQPPDSRKITAAEYASATGLRPGDRLGV